MDADRHTLARDSVMKKWVDQPKAYKLCRVCGFSNDSAMPIFDGEGFMHGLGDKINLYLPIKVLREDALPLQVCHDCASAILSWHDIFNNCRRVDVKLRYLLEMSHADLLNPVDANPTLSSSSQCCARAHSEKNQPLSQICSPPLKSQTQKTVIIQDAPEFSSLKNNTTSLKCSTPDDSALQCLSKVSQSMDESSTRILLPRRNSRTNSVVIKKKRPSQGISTIKTTSDKSSHCNPEKTSLHFAYMDKLPPNRVSAIQSTSSLNELSSGRRSETVLVRNKSVCSDKHPSEKIDSNNATSLPLKLSPDTQLNSIHGTSVVLFARPTCLRRAPTKYKGNEEIKLGADKPSDLVTVPVSDSFTRGTEGHEGVIVAVSQSDVTSPDSFKKEDRCRDPSRICFLCGKVINNIVLLRAHEKGHLFEQQPPKSFVCKFCSQPQNSFSEMSFHHAHHEVEAERKRKNSAHRRALLCKYCGQMCTTEEKLTLHQRTHLDNMKAFIHSCKTCGLNLNTRSKLSVHLLKHVVKPSHKLLKCHICGQGFTMKSALEEHRSKHTKEERSKAFKCVICGVAFKNNALLGKHRATHSKEELARPFRCSICGKAFARNHTLQIHHLSHSDEKKHLCSQCGKGYKMRHSLIQHLRSHQGLVVWPSFPCHLCTKTFRIKSRLEDHIRRHKGEKPFACSTCGKQFHSAASVHTHEIIHTEQRPYICDTCGKAFRWSKNLRQHRAVHGDISDKRRRRSTKCGRETQNKQYQCEVCGKQFAGRSSLRQHIVNIHDGGTQKQANSSPCPICGKVLSNAGGLTRHLKITHGGIKAFKCDLCEREFTSKVARDDHRRSHTGERPFSCNLCSKTFTSLSNLHTHRTIHSDARPHKCSFCEKQFKRKAHLILHTRTHTGEKPYVCDICNRGFAQSNDLHKHRLTHSKDRAHTCHCGMAYRMKRDLTQHQLEHHPPIACLKEDPYGHGSSPDCPEARTSCSLSHQSIAVIQEIGSCKFGNEGVS